MTFTTVTISRAVKGGVSGKGYDKSIPWLAAGLSFGAQMIAKSPGLIASVEDNVSNWWHGAPTHWDKTLNLFETTAADSLLSAVQGALLVTNLAPDVVSGSEVWKESLKQVAFGGIKNLVKNLFGV